MSNPPDVKSLLGMGGYTAEPAGTVKERPKLPDGSYYACDWKYQELADSLLSSFLAGYQFKNRPEHTYILRMLLDMNVNAARMNAQANEAETSPNPNWRQITTWRNASLKTTDTLTSIYAKMGMFKESDSDQNPQQYVDELRKRATDFAKAHALEKAYACKVCGHISMVYSLQSFAYRPKWELMREHLRRRGLSVEEAEKIIVLLSDAPIPAFGDVVHTPHSHPFLNHDTFPIWSPVIREMIENEKCTCGLPKLTIADGARILQISGAGMDQMLQEANKLEGKEAVPGTGLKAAASVFVDDAKELLDVGSPADDASSEES